MNKELLKDPIRKRYNRIALIYDYMEAPIENFRFSRWRNRLMSHIKGDRVLEVGVGTGKNLRCYPPCMNAVAIDFSTAMLNRARKKVSGNHLNVELIAMDIQHMAFADNSFDTIFGTFVFCSVPDPIMGLKELNRICRPNGKLLLIEHLRPGNSILGIIFDLINPVIVRTIGANVNRRTLKNIQNAQWHIRSKEPLFSDIVWWIEAEPIKLKI